MFNINNHKDICIFIYAIIVLHFPLILFFTKANKNA